MRHLTEEDREDLTIGPKHLERVTDTRDDLHAPRAWAERIGSLCCCRRGHGNVGPQPEDPALHGEGATRCGEARSLLTLPGGLNCASWLSTGTLLCRSLSRHAAWMLWQCCSVLTRIRHSRTPWASHRMTGP